MNFAEIMLSMSRVSVRRDSFNKGERYFILVMRKLQYIGIIGSLMAVILFLMSCARSGVEPFLLPETSIIWPLAPEPPRIQFIKSFSQPEELGIVKGVFTRIEELFAGNFEPHLVRPMAVVRTPDGVVYVADPGSKGIHRFAPAKNRYDLIRGEDGNPLLSPVGLAVGPDETIYVADSLLGQIFRIPPKSKVAIPVALHAIVEQPTAIAIDPDTGRLYVVDTKAHQVKIFESNGTLRATFGQRGDGNGEFNYPTAIWRDETGLIVVIDALNFRIQLFDEEGSFLKAFGEAGNATGYFSRPKGVAMDPFDHIYVVDALFHTIQIFDLSGNFLLSFGNQGQGSGEFWLPTGIFINEQDMIFIADSYNQRIQVFRYIGGQP